VIHETLRRNPYGSVRLRIGLPRSQLIRAKPKLGTTPVDHPEWSRLFFSWKNDIHTFASYEPTRNAGLAAIAAVVRLLLHVRATPQPPSWHVPAAGVWAALRRLNAAFALDLSPFGAREANAAWKVLDEHGVAVRRAELCTRGSPLPRIPISDLEPNRAVVSRPQADGERHPRDLAALTAPAPRLMAGQGRGRGAAGGIANKLLRVLAHCGVG